MRPPTLDERGDRFLREPNYAVIATIRPDDFPMTVVTWYDWEDGRVLVNMAAGRSRLRWMRSNPRVSLTVLDRDLTRHASLFGSIVDVHDDSELADIDRLAIRYTGGRFGDRAGPRVSAWIEPRGWHCWDPGGELNAGPWSPR